MGNDIFQKLAAKYPFITLCIYANEEYVGVVQNRDDAVTTIYDFGAVQNQQDKLDFLELANVWWWESNRLIPINVFLRFEWTQFRYCLKTLNSKDVQIKFGPYVSLKEIAAKKSKRRSITLVRKLP